MKKRLVKIISIFAAIVLSFLFCACSCCKENTWARIYHQTYKVTKYQYPGKNVYNYNKDITFHINASDDMQLPATPKDVTITFDKPFELIPGTGVGIGTSPSVKMTVSRTGDYYGRPQYKATAKNGVITYEFNFYEAKNSERTPAIYMVVKLNGKEYIRYYNYAT